MTRLAAIAAALTIGASGRAGQRDALWRAGAGVQEVGWLVRACECSL